MPAARELLLTEADGLQPARADLAVHCLAIVGAARQREHRGIESEALNTARGNQGKELERLRRRTPERHEVGITRLGHQVPRRVDNSR